MNKRRHKWNRHALQKNAKELSTRTVTITQLKFKMEFLYWIVLLFWIIKIT